jgi:hypothetical protein
LTFIGGYGTLSCNGVVNQQISATPVNIFLRPENPAEYILVIA